MANKLWGGVFGKPASEALFEFASAEDAQLDGKLAQYDIEGSLAHVCMLSKQKILQKHEAKEILASLAAVQKQGKEGKFRVDPKLEDVHTNVEAAVAAITPAGKNMHIARSRNDQLSVDLRMYLRDAINEVSSSIIGLQDALAQLAKRDCPFVAYTHFQVAQPISLAFWCHAHHCALSRDLERLGELYARVNTNPLGSGAVAGTAWNIDREFTSRLLGFSAPTANPMDSVGCRGELEAEYLGALALAMVHASRIAEDTILLANKRIIILPDEYSTGSSMMPQKKNPDPFEIIRGRASRMLGLYVMTASLSRGLPSGFNRDTQESKFSMLMGTEVALGTFAILSKAVPLLEFDEGEIALELERGYACATELADLLAKRGVPFRTAHGIAGKLVKGCVAKKKFLSQLKAGEVSAAAGVKISEGELKEAVSVDKTARFASKYKIPSSSAHAKQLEERKKALGAARALLAKEVAALAK